MRLSREVPREGKREALNTPSLLPSLDTYAQCDLEAMCGRWQSLCAPGASHSCIISSIFHKNLPPSISASRV